MDPAHAREYSCRGIPDENQDPTLVYYGRDTITLHPSYYSVNTLWCLEGTAWKKIGSATDIKWDTVYVIQTGDILNNIIVVLVGSGTVSSATKSLLSVVIQTGDADVKSGDTARLVAQSLTFSWAGKELNRGGLFESGYVPYSSVKNTDGRQTAYLDLGGMPNYATYTGSSEDGCYIVGAFNQYDMYKWWKTAGSKNLVIKVLGYPVTLTFDSEFVVPSTVGGWRTSVVRYITNGEADWILRLTFNQVVEVLRPYSAGGTDAASYDMASVQDVIAMYDSMDLIFPARFNDFKKVWDWIKSNAPKAIPIAVSVLSHFPQAGSVVAALNCLVGKPITPLGAQKVVVQSTKPKKRKKKRSVTVTVKRGGRVTHL